MDDIEWVIHHINRDIDNANKMLETSIFYSKDSNIHYHSCAGNYCTEDNLRLHGGCAGPSPYALLKNVLESAMKALNDKYPTTPLNELSCEEGKPIVPPET
jgi:hypothetical protein